MFPDKLPKARELLMEKSDPSHIEIRRIDSLFHPVRYLNPPGKPQYGVFARSFIGVGTPIVCYKGEVITQYEFDSMKYPQYTFDFGMDLSLHINADDYGNEGRYVNDCFGRVWGNKEDSEVANAQYVVCWDSLYSIPVLFIASTRNISKGEEVVVDYGKDTYWNPLLHALGKKHADYYVRSLQVVHSLEAVLEEHKIPLPRRKHWKELLECPEGKLYKPLPPNAATITIKSQEDEESSEVEVEQLVAKREMPFGTQYLVKWKNFDWSHTTWSHERELPPLLVSDFESVNKKQKLGNNNRNINGTTRSAARNRK